MGGLVLKLGPNERVLINGVVVENGDRRTKLNIITKGANILRLRDALHPSEVQTPVRRVCYILQLILSGDVEESEGCKQVVHGVKQLSLALLEPNCKEILSKTLALLEEGNFYAALKCMRILIKNEDILINLSQKNV